MVRSLVVGVSFLWAMAAEPAHASSITIGQFSLTISGPGSVSIQPGSVVSIGASGTYVWQLQLVNLTGTAQSEAAAASFLDVLLELEIDSVNHTCGSSASLAAGATLACVVNLAMSAGLHLATPFATTYLPNPLLLADGTLFDIDRLGGGGPEVPVAPRPGGGMSAGTKYGIVAAVVGGGAVAGIVASGRRREGPVVPEPATLGLLAGGLVLVLVRRRVGRSAAR